MKTDFPSEAFGITSSIPIEVPLAAGKQVIDLNNRFIFSENPSKLIRLAETVGFPRNCCAWIKGIFGYILENKVRRVIFVTGGDCSNTHAMLDTLVPHLDEIKTFSYPFDREKNSLLTEITRFCDSFSITLADAEEKSCSLVRIRNDLSELDKMTWDDGLVSGKENHIWLVSSSDFDGDSNSFHERLMDFLRTARKRTRREPFPRIGILGVPPIQSDFHELIEGFGAQSVFNEIPRQFAMIGNEKDILSRYLAFTYPYGVWTRATDIMNQAALRKIDGFIHYTQAFCHRQIHDIILRAKINIPILTLEGDSPGPCDQRTRLRIESFIEIIKERRLNKYEKSNL